MRATPHTPRMFNDPMSNFIKALALHRRPGIRNEQEKSQLLKSACSAYFCITNPFGSFTFFGDTFGAHHHNKVDEWLAAPTLTVRDLHDYVRTLNAIGTPYNPGGSFAKTFGKILNIHPAPIAPDVTADTAPVVHT